MAKRPDNHITGDNAVHQILAQLLPPEWTASEPQKDYGVDLIVEVVIDNETTGKIFFMQSKGTIESANADGSISYSIRVDRLLDYSRMPNPVMLVYYSETDNVFWGKWLNALYSNLSVEQKQQNTITITFSKENVLDREYLRNIGGLISPTLPGKCNLKAIFVTDECERFHKQVSNILLADFGSCLSIDNRLAWNELLLTYTGDLSNMTISMTHAGYTATIEQVSCSSQFLWYPNATLENCPSSVRLMLFALSFIMISEKNNVSNYWDEDQLDTILKIVPIECLAVWVLKMIPQERAHLESLLRAGIDNRALDAVSLMLVAMLSRGDDYHKMYETYTLKLAEITDTPQSRYNCANSLRCEGKVRESIKLYCEAARLEPTYRNLEYWNYEVAGSLFLCGHYWLAELFYKKAYLLLNDKSDKPLIRLLIADCLAHQRKVDEAISWIEEQMDDEIKMSQNLPADLLLRHTAYEVLKSKLGNSGDSYPADNIFWFNSGVSAAQNNEYGIALECFLCAWVLKPEDVESLENAMKCAINEIKEAELALILATLLDIVDDQYKKTLIDEIAEWNIPFQSKEGLYKIIGYYGASKKIEAE